MLQETPALDRVSEIRDDDREVPELERFARLLQSRTASRDVGGEQLASG